MDSIRRALLAAPHLRSLLRPRRSAGSPGPAAASRLSSSSSTADATAALIEEWRVRRNGIAHGSSDLLDRVLSHPNADPNGVFANCDLFLGDIDTYGFDLDFTCVTYTEALHTFLYDTALNTLVEKLRYPVGMAGLRYDPSFPSRGVFFDDVHATLIKVDAVQHIDVAFRGRRELSVEEISNLYPVGGHVKYDRLVAMRFLADLFCSSEICLIADVVQFLDSAGFSFEPAHVYSDCMAAIGDAHRSGIMYREIERDPHRYIVSNPNMLALFRRLKAAGKRQFLLTNSPWQYVDASMSHLCLGPEWRSLFEVVITQAGKPDFYTSNRPFRRIMPDSNRVDWSPVSSRDFLRDKNTAEILMGGNLASFVKMTGWDRHVLYCGDHIESDMRDPRRYGWRTAMMLSETSRDVVVNNSEEYRTALTMLLEAKDFLANIYSTRRSVHADAKAAARYHVEKEVEQIRRNMRLMFGSPFGSPFSCATSSSLFAMRVARWCDIYHSQLDNLLSVELDAFVSPRSTTTMLPHGVRVQH